MSGLIYNVTRTGLKSSFVARLARCEARRGKQAKQPEVYPQRYTEDFFAKFDEVAARISSTEAEDAFETSSTNFSDGAVDSWIEWFERIYAPEILKTGTFVEVTLLNVAGREEGGKTYAVQHYSESRDDYERYQTHFHSKMTSLIQQAFGDNVHSFSTVLEVVSRHR
jgi:hypothetical protein